MADVDVLIKEYLLYRGYQQAYSAFEADRTRDTSSVDSIVSQIGILIKTLRLDELDAYWATLEARLFSRLSADFADAVRDIHTSVWRHFLVGAVRQHDPETVADFFAKHSAELTESSALNDWSAWFALPYVDDPEHHPTFQPYFNAKWVDAFFISFRNFLNVAFQQLPPPKLMGFQTLQHEREDMIERLQELRLEVKRLRHQNANQEKMLLSLKLTNQELLGRGRSSQHDSSNRAPTASSSPVAGSAAILSAATATATATAASAASSSRRKSPLPRSLRKRTSQARGGHGMSDDRLTP